MKRLVAFALVAAFVMPVAASAQNLYVNLKRLRVEDKRLASGCELTVRTALDGDKMKCTDPDGNTLYHWHKIQLKMMYGVIQHTCEINVIKENHRAFRFRWHATITPGSAQCKMHWVNDNTLDIEPGIR